MAKAKWSGPDSGSPGLALVTIKPGWTEFHSGLLVDWFFPACCKACRGITTVTGAAGVTKQNISEHSRFKAENQSIINRNLFFQTLKIYFRRSIDQSYSRVKGRDHVTLIWEDQASTELCTLPSYSPNTVKNGLHPSGFVCMHVYVYM